MDFFFVWFGEAATAGSELGFERLVVAVAVANFYGFLLRRLTLTTASPLTYAAPGCEAIPGHFGEVSSQL